MNVEVMADADAVARHAAEGIAGGARAAVTARGRFVVAAGTIGLAMVTIVTNTVRCVQEADDGSARTLLQTLTLPSEDADILK
jgi:hypothetical protein